MAKTTRKTTTAKKTTRRKSTTAKESAKKSPSRTASKTGSRTTSSTRSQKASSKKEKAGETEVTIDRRRSQRRTQSDPTGTERRKLERREKVTRRRQIDPTTCERDYSDEEVEFMNALDHYKRTSGRMFPTCSEVLEVIRKLGYVKVSTDHAASGETAPDWEQAAGEILTNDLDSEDLIDDLVGEEVLV